MRILHITPSFQHPKVRGPNRHYHFLRELSKNHAVTLLTLARSEIPTEAREEIASYTEQVITYEVKPTNGSSASRPITSAPIYSDSRLEREWRLRQAVRQMRKTFRSLTRVEKYDVVLFHGKSVFPVIEDWNGLPIVVDFCDATSLRIRDRMNYVDGTKRLLLKLRYIQVRRIEEKLVRKTPYLAFISSRDREAILGLDSKADIIANGLDLNYWRRKTDSARTNCLALSGVMDYAPNEDAALYLTDEILPLLRQSSPDIEVIIIGRDPTPALIDRSKRHPEVTVTGYVDDMRPYLEQATIFAAPVRYASGQQNKIQEALAMEIPVVTTSIVAAGVQAEGGQEAPVYVADGAQAFADSVIDLLEKPEERLRLASLGRQYAEEHYDWSRSAEHLERMCYAAIEARK